jgi:pimeloyl-ACP methyl ester carboxylesterase
MKTAVVFVHGFSDTKKCWKPFLDLLAADEQLKADFTFDCYPYETEWFNSNPLEKIPALRDLGSAFGGFLKRGFADYPRWILVGHSQGGLVIQNYLMQKTLGKEARDLAKIRSVVLFACPNLGSDIFSGIRKIAFNLNPNPQERTLRVLNPEISDMRKYIQLNVLNATSVTDTSCPIAFQAFWGESDAVVPMASARGDFLEAEGLAGNHFTIIRPEDSSDDRYKALREALLHPVGNPAFYEVDLIDVRLEVSPCPIDQPYQARYGTTERSVVTDNRAHRYMKLTFASGNRCVTPYKIQYRTKSDGFVRFLTIREPNGADTEAQSRYDERGTELSYSFTPIAGEKFWMDVEIYKGYDQGNRNWHDHIPNEVRCATYRFTLDLTAYLDAGFTISKEPEFFWSPVDVEHDREVPDQRSQETRAERRFPAERGIWVWELPDYQGGLLDLDWDVARAP